jgi:hypothetical protein
MASTAVLSRPKSLVSTRPARPKWADDSLVASLDFALARDLETFDAAFRLVHDQYVWREYMAPEASGRRVNIRHALPSTRVFVACAPTRLVGTVSLFRDSVLGLPMDDLYRAELDLLRADGRQLAEVSHLATAPGGRVIGLAVLMRLFRVMVLYAAEFAGLDDLCLVISPRHAAFYETYIECDVIGDVRFYRTVGVPAVAMRLDLQRVRDVMADLRAGGGRDHEVRSFLYDPDVLPGIASRLERDAPRSALTAEQFGHFFHGSAAMRNATPEQRLLIESLHRDRAASGDGTGLPGAELASLDLGALEPAAAGAYARWGQIPLAASMVGR